MKTRKLFIVVMAIVALAFLLMPLLLLAQTNDLAATNALKIASVGTNALNLPTGFEQVVNTLPPNVKAFVWKVLAWIGAFSTVFAAIGGIIDRWLRNKLNAASAGPGQDEKLRRWFSNPLYIMLGYFVRLFSINLPTVAELDRAVRLQQEAVRDAFPTGQGTGGA